MKKSWRKPIQQRIWLWKPWPRQSGNCREDLRPGLPSAPSSGWKSWQPGDIAEDKTHKGGDHADEHGILENVSPLGILGAQVGHTAQQLFADHRHQPDTHQNGDGHDQGDVDKLLCSYWQEQREQTYENQRKSSHCHLNIKFMPTKLRFFSQICKQPYYIKICSINCCMIR